MVAVIVAVLAHGPSIDVHGRVDCVDHDGHSMPANGDDWYDNPSVSYVMLPY